MSESYNVIWRFLSAPIRYFMKGRVKQAKRDVKKCNREIELHKIGIKRMGRISMNNAWLMHNLSEKQRLERFINRWS